MAYNNYSEQAQETLHLIEDIQSAPTPWYVRVKKWALKLLHNKRLARAMAEDRALNLQIMVANGFIDLRREAHQGTLPLPNWPETEPLPLLSHEELNYNVIYQLSLLHAINRALIPPRAKEDILADYWNKWAFITWERALLEEVPQKRDVWLQYVGRYLNMIEQMPNRSLWTPLQMNRIRLELARSVIYARLDDSKGVNSAMSAANAMLNQVLGIEPPTPTLPAAAPVVDIDNIAAAVIAWASDRDAIATASNMRRGYPGLSADVLGKIAVALAGKVPATLLDQIFRQYSACQ